VREMAGSSTTGMRERRVVAAVGEGGYVDGEEWKLTSEVFWQPQAGAKVHHLRSLLCLECCCIGRNLANFVCIVHVRCSADNCLQRRRAEKGKV
jgi:hypothetical protein